MNTEELAARQQAALDKVASYRGTITSLREANANALETIGALQAELARLTAGGADVAALQARLTETTNELTRSNTLLQELQDALLNEPEPPAEPETPLTPEQAAAIEFEAGATIARAGGTLPDLASDAAKAGFASVTPPAPPDVPETETTPAEEAPPEAPPEA